MEKILKKKLKNERKRIGRFIVGWIRKKRESCHTLRRTLQ